MTALPAHSALAAAPGQSRYGALAAALRERIVAGAWRPGQALPSEQTLANAHGVALGTLRQALDLLAEQGLLERRQGRGTFVRLGLSGTPMLRFFRFGQGLGEDTVPSSRILRREVRPPPAAVARTLLLAAGVPALRLQRLRSLQRQPVLHEDIWLPLPLFDALAHSDTATWGDLLYPLYAERCGVHVHRATDTIGFGTLAAGPARALRLPAGQACARVQRLALDIAGHAIEWRTTLGDAQALHYTVSIT